MAGSPRVMGKATHAQTTSAHVPKAILPLIAERARLRGLTPSKYIGILLTDWHSRGMPEPDMGAQLKLMRLLKGAPLEFPERIGDSDLRAAEPRLQPHDRDQPA
jgi:hypothetical protein